MEKFKGTPGPWHLSIPTNTGKWAGFNTQQGKCYGIYATNDDLEAISIVPKDDWLCHSVQDNLANAHLIAAAPELLEALQDLDGYFCAFTPLEKNASIKAKAAIAKALGTPINETDPATQSNIEREVNNAG